MAKFSAGTLLLGLIAVMFGLLGAYVIRKELHKPQVEAAPTEVATYLVPRASTDLQSGREITLSDIAVSRMTLRQMADAGITGEFMSSTRQIIGRVIRTDIPKGDTFDTDLFYPEGTGPNVAEKLESGFRAVTVTVEGAAAVAGFASPGSMVDVLFRADRDEDNDLPETTVMLIEGVEVLALNNETFTGARSGEERRSNQASVTLAVTPDHAAALRVVEGRGSLSLALRNPNDELVLGGPQPRTLNDLLERPDTRHRMEVYRGRALSRVEFRDSQRAGELLTPDQLANRPISTTEPRPAPRAEGQTGLD